MISLFLEAYGTLLLLVGLICSIVFIYGFYFIWENWRIEKTVILPALPTNTVSKKSHAPLPVDVRAIAGDDVFATQLDLARAYLESNKKPLAKSMLNIVHAQGSPEQRQAAAELLNNI